MKNISIIFAGGSGKRMNTVSRPKQFLELNGKPVIIYTLELFDNHPQIDGIVVVCIEPWIPFLEKQLNKFEINEKKSLNFETFINLIKMTPLTKFKVNDDINYNSIDQITIALNIYVLKRKENK